MNRRECAGIGFFALGDGADAAVGARAGQISGAADQADGRVLGRRRERRRRPPVGRAGEDAARHRLRGEPGRRHRHDRDRRGRARARDGYTILLGSTSTMVLNPMTMAKVPYDPAKDFVPVAILCVSTTSIVVHASVPAKNLKELIAYAKANPGKLSYGSAGTGTMSNLSGELFKQLTGLNQLVHIPVQGRGARHHRSRQRTYSDDDAEHDRSGAELHRTGKIRILAVNAAQRLEGGARNPDRHREGRAGHDRASCSSACSCRRRRPRPIVDRIGEATRAAMADPEFQKVLVTSGLEASRRFQFREGQAVHGGGDRALGSGGQGRGPQGGVRSPPHFTACDPLLARRRSATRSTLLVEASGSSSTNQTKRGCA